MTSERNSIATHVDYCAHGQSTSLPAYDVAVFLIGGRKVRLQLRHTHKHEDIHAITFEYARRAFVVVQNGLVQKILISKRKHCLGDRNHPPWQLDLNRCSIDQMDGGGLRQRIAPNLLLLVSTIVATMAHDFVSLVAHVVAHFRGEGHGSTIDFEHNMDRFVVYRLGDCVDC